MGFLIRSAFWLSLVLLVIPIGQGSESDSAQQVGPIDALFAAQAVVGDVAGLCGRNPEACEVGKAALSTIGVRAREGARIAYGMMDETTDDRSADEMLTGSIASVAETTADAGHGVPVPTPRDAALAR